MIFLLPGFQYIVVVYSVVMLNGMAWYSGELLLVANVDSDDGRCDGDDAEPYSPLFPGRCMHGGHRAALYSCIYMYGRDLNLTQSKRFADLQTTDY